MARKYLILTKDDIIDSLTDALYSRERELMSYDFEVATHTAAIAALGHLAWDTTTQKYKGLARDQMLAMALADGLSEARIHHIANLLALDRHTLNLHAVRIELARSEAVYASLLAELPPGKARDAAIARRASGSTPRKQLLAVKK